MMGSVLKLSKEDLENCTVGTLSQPENEETPISSEAPEIEFKTGPSLTCHVCHVGIPGGDDPFLDVMEQREHFKTDWHRYNIHRSLKQQSPLAREAFETLIEKEDVSSISGSDSDDDDLQQKESKHSNETKMLTITFQDGRSVRVWKCLIAQDRTTRAEIESIDWKDALQQLIGLQRWAVILARAGHFAAACFERTSASTSNKTGTLFDIKQHKTFHRYVVRAKAGKRQSSKDASGKAARSAGSTLRRYNEAALEKEIAEVLTSWKKELDLCDLIFTSISSGDMKAIFGGDAPPLDMHDSRIRKIPFMTRRPTFSETKRVSGVLLSLFEIQETGETPVVLEKPEPAMIEEEKEVSDPVIDETHLEPVLTQLPKTSKKKSKRKPKSKDERRKEAVRSIEKFIEDTEQEGVKSEDDEVERAIAEAAKEIKKTQPKKLPVKKKQDLKKPESMEERRELMRKAAEQRMTNLQSAAKKQQLW